MSRYHSYFNSSIRIIEAYDSRMPLSHFLKLYFSGEGKFGATDRKTISHWVYAYFRLGWLQKNASIPDRLKLALQLITNQTDPWRYQFLPDLDHLFPLPIIDRLPLVIPEFSAANHFPFGELLSAGLHITDCSNALLAQPYLFIRIRPNRHQQVVNVLNSNAIPFEQLTENCLSLPPTTKVQNLFSINSDVVIQDRNSQQTGKIIGEIVQHAPKNIWDACAASGGKTIMLYDVFDGKPQFTVSDIRPSILANLKIRLREAKITPFQVLQIDLTDQNCKLTSDKFEMIVADVPCSGSGTWSRTPEQLYYFDPLTLASFHQKQVTILKAALPRLQTGGWLVYITCSVFKQENEDVVETITGENALDVVHAGIIEGTQLQADTMYLAILRKK